MTCQEFTISLLAGDSSAQVLLQSEYRPVITIIVNIKPQNMCYVTGELHEQCVITTTEGWATWTVCIYLRSLQLKVEQCEQCVYIYSRSLQLKVEQCEECVYTWDHYNWRLSNVNSVYILEITTTEGWATWTLCTYLRSLQLKVELCEQCVYTWAAWAVLRYECRLEITIAEGWAAWAVLHYGLQVQIELLEQHCIMSVDFRSLQAKVDRPPVLDTLLVVTSSCTHEKSPIWEWMTNLTGLSVCGAWYNSLLLCTEPF